jgi:hypothetical protein
MTPLQDSLYAATVHLLGTANHSDTALRAVAQNTAVAMVNGQTQTAVQAYSKITSGPVAPGEYAYLYDFFASAPTVGAGGALTYGFYASSGHDFGLYSNGSGVGFFSDGALTDGFYSTVSGQYNFYSNGATNAGFYSNGDAIGINVNGSTTDAIRIEAGSDINLRMYAATSYDIYSYQSKVTFEFLAPTAETFYLNAADLGVLGAGRTDTNGMFKINCPVQSHAVAQLVDLWSTLAASGSDQLGGVSFSTTLTSGPTNAVIGPLLAAGVMTGYEAIHTTNKDDDAAAIHQTLNAEFTFTNSGGGAVADEGPTAYGLRVSMPETIETATGHYHNNDGTYTFNRWAINVVAGESTLRRTIMEGPSNLNKAVLHVSQKDVNCEIVTLQGTSDAAPVSGNLCNTLGAGTLQGPKDGSWNFVGMFRVRIVDDNAGIMNGERWIPLYSAV